jgi:uncharacterized protein (TIGR02145 family)
MKKIFLIVSLFTVLCVSAQQDTLFVWKSGQLVMKQSILPADMDSITFKRPLNFPGPNVTDIDGNTYQSVTNCALTFTKENLNVSKYSDGTPIPQVTSSNYYEWSTLTTGAWCYYNDDPANEAIYGKLYNWYAVAGIYDAASLANPALRKKLAPTGWHIPTDAEWTQLIDCLGGEVVAGGKMKATGEYSAGTGLWAGFNVDATNISGMTCLPGGYRAGFQFFNKLYSGFWWSSSSFSDAYAWYRFIESYNGIAYRDSYGKKMGYSVRCIKD